MTDLYEQEPGSKNYYIEQRFVVGVQPDDAVRIATGTSEIKEMEFPSIDTTVRYPQHRDEAGQIKGQQDIFSPAEMLKFATTSQDRPDGVDYAAIGDDVAGIGTELARALADTVDDMLTDPHFRSRMIKGMKEAAEARRKRAEELDTFANSIMGHREHTSREVLPKLEYPIKSRSSLDGYFDTIRNEELLNDDYPQKNITSDNPYIKSMLPHELREDFLPKHLKPSESIPFKDTPLGKSLDDLVYDPLKDLFAPKKPIMFGLTGTPGTEAFDKLKLPDYPGIIRDTKMYELNMNKDPKKIIGSADVTPDELAKILAKFKLPAPIDIEPPQQD